MRRDEFVDTIEQCIALFQLCDASSNHTVLYAYDHATERLHAHFENGNHHVCLDQHQGRCYGDFASPLLDPQGRAFPRQPNLPLRDANALRGFLFVHLCPFLARIDALKCLCGEGTSLQWSLDETGTFWFSSPLNARRLPLRVNAHGTLVVGPHSPMRTAASYELSSAHAGSILEHSSFIRPRQGETPVMDTNTKALIDSTLKALLVQ